MTEFSDELELLQSMYVKLKVRINGWPIASRELHHKLKTLHR
jgi:hypothetical protein